MLALTPQPLSRLGGREPFPEGEGRSSEGERFVVRAEAQSVCWLALTPRPPLPPGEGEQELATGGYLCEEAYVFPGVACDMQAAWFLFCWSEVTHLRMSDTPSPLGRGGRGVRATCHSEFSHPQDALFLYARNSRSNPKSRFPHPSQAGSFVRTVPEIRKTGPLY